MKNIVLSILFILCTGIVSAQERTDSIRVAGNCEHCKERIEGTLSAMKGLSFVQWQPDKGSVFVKYNESLLTNAQIQKAIAAVGHDTGSERADDKVYRKLPACCKYERFSYDAPGSSVKTIEFKIVGMTCAEGCAKGIETEVYKQKGVKMSKVDFETQKAKVVYDSTKISKEQLISIIQNFKPESETGRDYKVVEIK